MTEGSNRFVFRILIWHMLLLAGVLAVVLLASSEIYRSTRDDAINDAKARQELLTYQTCRGIETFYSSIVTALGWIQGQPDLDISSTDETRVRAETYTLDSGRRPVAADLIAEQLGDRVSTLFVYYQRRGGIIPILPANVPGRSIHLTTEIHDWLGRVNSLQVSRFLKIDGKGVSLVAVPLPTVVSPLRRLGAGATTMPSTLAAQHPTTLSTIRRLLVAVVPGSEVEQNFRLLDDPSLDAGDTATLVALVDNQLQVITSSDRALADYNLANLDNADAAQMVSDFHAHPHTVTRLFTQPLTMFGTPMGPRMVTLAPIHVGQDEWALFYAYPLSNIDSAVNTLFRRAVIWAGFLAAAVTGVLVSTAVQMIHSRIRLERVRHDLLTRELKQARRIQERWLPEASATIEGLDIAAINRPASHISGDFYNWFEVADGKRVFVIGDVTGHGMAAAFLMATTQLLVRNIMARIPDPGAAMEAVNQQLTSQMFHGQFVTMLILTLDFQRNQFEAASAGHPPPLIGAGNGNLRRLDMEAQLVLGVEKEVHYPTQRFALPPLSSLLLYTDGVIEARTAKGDCFGPERMLESLQGHCGSAREMVDAVSDSIGKFCGDLAPEDDVTLVAIRLGKIPLADLKIPGPKIPKPRQLPSPI